jgi:HK97 family phage major capsid protein
MDPRELAAQRASVQEKIDGILAKEQLAADDREQVKTLEAEFEKLSVDITAAEQQAKEDAAARQRSKARAEMLSTSAGRKTQPDSTSGGQPVVRVKDPDEFRSLGEQLCAIANAAFNTGHIDNRLKWESLAPATGSAVAGVASDGGYLIQKDFSTALLSRMNEIGSVKGSVTTIPIGANSDGLQLPAVDETSRATGSRWGGVQVYWGAEADAATAKKPKFRMMDLNLHDLIGLAYASNRLLRDASAVGAVFSQAFAEEMNFMIEDALVRGTGAGQPLGVLNAGCTVSVSKETNQAAATIVYENLLKMHARLWARSRPKAKWYINQDAEPQLDLLYHAVGTGGIPAGFITQGADGVTRIKGLPVVPVEYCSTLGTVGDIILADLSQMVAIDKDAMQSESSIHVRFTTNENTFRFIYRYDAQPTWSSALTPYKGSNTLSPFVTLATRS